MCFKKNSMKFVINTLGFLFICFNASAQVDLNDGLIYHFNFEESIIDLQENTSITIYGNASLAPNDTSRPSNTALELTGEDTFLALNDSENFNGEDDFSITLWVRIPEEQTVLTSGGNAILSKWALEDGFNPNKGYPFSLRINNSQSSEDGKIKFIEYDSKDFGCKNVSEIATTKTHNDNKFHHIVFGKKDNKLFLYVDNELVGQIDSKAICTTANDSKIFLGARNEIYPNYFPNNFTGDIDDLRFYSRFLTEDEIEELYSVSSNIEDEEKTSTKCSLLNTLPNVFCSEYSFPKTDYELTIFDINGKIVQGNPSQINFHKLEESIYFVKIVGCEKIHKMIKMCK